jgi:hypothetical protein
MKLNKGDHILFHRRDDPDRLHHEVVENVRRDARSGRRVVLLKDGTKAYLSDIVEVNNTMPPVEWAWE